MKVKDHKCGLGYDCMLTFFFSLLSSWRSEMVSDENGFFFTRREWSVGLHDLIRSWRQQENSRVCMQLAGIYRTLVKEGPLYTDYIIQIVKIAWVTDLGALSRLNATMIPRISAHPPVLAQYKVHRPWALFHEDTVHVRPH